MTSESGGVKLGELLTGANVVSPDNLRQAVAQAKEQSLPVGRVLIMAGFVTEEQLQRTVEVQSMVKDGRIDRDMAFKVLDRVTKVPQLSVQDAFEQLASPSEIQKQQTRPTNKLGEFLMESGIIHNDLLDYGLQQANECGLPLGRILVMCGIMSEQLLASALMAQIFVRDGKISREQAIQGLRSARERQVPIEDSLQVLLPTPEQVRLGELMMLAELADEGTVMHAVEVGLIEEKPVGQVLVEHGLIQSGTLNTALALQQHIGKGSLPKEVAAKMLALNAMRGLTIEEAFEEVQKDTQAKALAQETAEAQYRAAQNPLPVKDHVPSADTPTGTNWDLPVTEQQPPSDLPQAAPPEPAPQAPEQAQAQGEAKPEQLPFYQFLQMAGVVTALDIQAALKAGSKDSELMGKMLLLAGILDSKLLDSALKANQMLADGTLKSEQAIMALQFCQQNDMTLEQAFTALEWKLTGEDPVTQMRSPWVETGTHQSPTKRFGDILNR